MDYSKNNKEEIKITKINKMSDSERGDFVKMFKEASSQKGISISDSICSMSGEGFCPYEKEGGGCTVDGNCVNKLDAKIKQISMEELEGIPKAKDYSCPECNKESDMETSLVGMTESKFEMFPDPHNSWFEKHKCLECDTIYQFVNGT